MSEYDSSHHQEEFYIFSSKWVRYKNALPRANTENSKHILPEKGWRGLSPNVRIHVSVSDLYIPTIDLPLLLQEICGPILWICKSLTDTRVWKLGLGRPRNFLFLGIHKWDFRCSVKKNTTPGIFLIVYIVQELPACIYIKNLCMGRHEPYIK